MKSRTIYRIRKHAHNFQNSEKYSKLSYDDGEILSLTDSVNMPFRELVKIISDYELDAVGIMHTDVNVVSDSIKIIKEIYEK